MLKNCSKCRIWIFGILEFFTNFWPIKSDLSGNTVGPQASGFQKLFQIWPFLAFLMKNCIRSSLRSPCWMRLFLWFSNTVQSGYVAPGFLVVFCAPLCRGLLFSFDDSCDNIISLGCRQMVQDLIHFDTWHFALVTTCVCTTVTPCFPPSSSWTVLNQGNTRGEEDPRQLYGQFAFNSAQSVHKRTSNYQTISLFIFT